MSLNRLAKGPIIQTPVLQPVQGGIIKDAGGNTLVDSSGIVSGALMKSIAVTPSNFTPQNYPGVASDILVDGSAISFSLERQATVMVMGNLPVANDPANTSELVGIYVDNTQMVSTNISGTAAASLIHAQPTLWVVVALAAGQHSASWKLIADSTGTTWHIGIGGKTEVFLLGS